jgi:hypothetical protein
MIRNENGERGNPYIRPLEALKNLEEAPLINTTKETY